MNLTPFLDPLFAGNQTLASESDSVMDTAAIKTAKNRGQSRLSTGTAQLKCTLTPVSGVDFPQALHI